jgi:hypothetical protein
MDPHGGESGNIEHTWGMYNKPAGCSTPAFGAPHNNNNSNNNIIHNVLYLYIQTALPRKTFRNINTRPHTFFFKMTETTTCQNTDLSFRITLPMAVNILTILTLLINFDIHLRLYCFMPSIGKIYLQTPYTKAV